MVREQPARQTFLHEDGAVGKSWTLAAIMIMNTATLRSIARREETPGGGSKEDGDEALAQAHTATLKRPHSPTDDNNTRHKQIHPKTSTSHTTDPVPWFHPFHSDPFLNLEDLTANKIRERIAQHAATNEYREQLARDAATHSAFLPASYPTCLPPHFYLHPPLGKEKDEVPKSSLEEGKEEEGKEEEKWRLGVREEGCEVRKDRKGIEGGAEQGGEDGDGEGGKEGDGEGDEEDATEWAVHGGNVTEMEWELYGIEKKGGDSGEERKMGDIGCSKGKGGV